MQSHGQTSGDALETNSEDGDKTDYSGSAVFKEPTLSKNAITVLERRYLKKDEKGKVLEKPKDMMVRVAKTIASAEKSYGLQGEELLAVEKKFYDMISTLDFVPNSPTLMNAGRELGQLSACFVLPVGDSIDQIFDAIKFTALIHKSGGGCASSEARVFTTFCGIERFETLYERLRDQGLKENDYDGKGKWIDVSDLGIEGFSFDSASRSFALRKIQKVWRYDLTGEECIRIKTANNMSVQTSSWHPFLVQTKDGIAERRADELRTGDKLIVPSSDLTKIWPFKSAKVSNGVRITSPIAWTVGYLIGKTGRLDISEAASDEGVSMVVEEVFENLIAEDDIAPKDIDMLAPGDLAFLLKALDNRLFGRRSSGQIPEAIVKSPSDVILAFLAGLSDSIPATQRKDRLDIKLSSADLAKDVAALLSLTGTGAVMTEDGQSRILSIDRDASEKLLSRISKFSRRRIRKKPAPKEPALDSYSEDSYTTIDVIDAQHGEGHNRFYDLTVEGTNNYLAGEFGLTVVHNTGFSFSRLRPANDSVQTTKGVSSGPLSFMEVFNAATETIKQGGTRRGANMGILRIDHPDILEFIVAKKDTKRLTNFNISVAVTDKFMKAVKEKGKYDLVNPRSGQVDGQLDANMVFDLVVNMAWRNGEPGVIFIDNINKTNPTPEVGLIESTNPCGEQPLLPFESCNLGSINLAHMLKHSEGGWAIDWEKLKETTVWSVRFLDDVIDVNKYPLPQIDEMTKSNRKIGLGIMGFADMLLRLEVPYDSEEALEIGRNLMKFIHHAARDASVDLAKTRGSFPNFHRSTLKRKYHLMRNATVTTIAPTGTISIIAGCSSGIEPLFAIAYIRNVMDKDELSEVNSVFDEISKKRGFYSEELMKKVAEHGSVTDVSEIPEDVRKVFVTAHEITPECHVRMQAAFQEFTDNAVSKTVNFPNSATADDVRKVYMMSYDLGLKGVTVYRDGSRDEQVLNIGKVNRKEGEEAPSAPAETNIEAEPAKAPEIGGLKSPRPRPAVTRGTTAKMETGCGKLYITINEDEHGLCEVFTQMGKSGGCTASQAEAISRLISLSLRSGIDAKTIIKQLKGIRCPSPLWQPGGMILSCSDAIAKAIERYLEAKETPLKPSSEVPAVKKQNEVDKGDVCPECPECGAMVDYVEGCVVCRSCGYSRCW